MVRHVVLKIAEILDVDPSTETEEAEEALRRDFVNLDEEQALKLPHEIHIQIGLVSCKIRKRLRRKDVTAAKTAVA